MKIAVRFWRHNKLAVVVCMFGLFWCGVAAVMFLLYTQMVEQQGIYFYLFYYLCINFCIFSIIIYLVYVYSVHKCKCKETYDYFDRHTDEHV